MTLDQLVYFVAAAKQESVGRASRLAAISPSAISHSIAKLEEELGVPLFTRQNRRIRLTEQGRLLLERAEKILADVSRMKNDLSAESVELEGHFRLASTQSLAVRYVTAAWSRLQAKHPRLGISLQVMGSKKIAAQAAVSEIDLGFCFGPIAQPDLRSQVLAKEPFSVVVRKGHPVLKLGLGARAAALAQLPCTAARTYQGASDYEHPELERLKVKQRVDFVCETYDVAIQRLLHSSSWGLLPDWYLRHHRGRLQKVDLPRWNATVEILAIWPAARPLGRALSQLCASIF